MSPESKRFWAGADVRFGCRIRLTVVWLVLLALSQSAALRADLLRSGIEMLQRGDPAGALESFDKLLNRFGPSMAPGDEDRQKLATMLLYRAVAEFETGREDLARWSWLMARTFWPDIAKVDLAGFGRVGEFLVLQEARNPEGEGADLLLRDPLPEGLTPPRKTKSPAPDYDPRLRVQGVEDTVIVRLWIGPDGRVDSPHVLNLHPAREPGLMYTTLEALKRWEFEGARLHDQPVAVWYTVTVNFELR